MSVGHSTGKGRLFVPDERDAGYPMRRRMATAPAPALAIPIARTWWVGPILDQGQTPKCVAYAGKQQIRSSPVPDATGPDPDTLYRGAQENDEWEGTGYDGTSARGLMKYLQGLGYVESYHWADSAADVLEWVLRFGTVLLGADWTMDMERPNRDGLMRPTGEPVGGHETLIVAGDRAKGRVTVVNSWGRGWARAGRAYLMLEDLDRLLRSGADACAAVQRSPGRV